MFGKSLKSNGGRGASRPTPFMGRGAKGRNGASAQPGGVPGRPGTLDKLNMAEEFQASIPTQGQSHQFGAVAPGRIAALRKGKK